MPDFLLQMWLVHLISGNRRRQRRQTLNTASPLTDLAVTVTAYIRGAAGKEYAATAGGTGSSSWDLTIIRLYSYRYIVVQVWLADTSLGQSHVWTGSDRKRVGVYMLQYPVFIPYSSGCKTRFHKTGLKVYPDY